MTTLQVLKNVGSPKTKKKIKYLENEILFFLQGTNHTHYDIKSYNFAKNSFSSGCNL